MPYVNKNIYVPWAKPIFWTWNITIVQDPGDRHKEEVDLVQDWKIMKMILTILKRLILEPMLETWSTELSSIMQWTRLWIIVPDVSAVDAKP